MNIALSIICFKLACANKVDKSIYHFPTKKLRCLENYDYLLI